MATYHAIAATGQAILKLLSVACPKTEFPNAQFDLVQASDLQKAPFDEGVSLFLYSVTVNTTLRALSRRTGLDGKKRKAPVPIDLHFLLTAWGKTAVKQQHLLGWAIRTLEDTPILPAGLLNAASAVPDVFRGEESVELVMEPLSLQDVTNIWEVAQTNRQPSVAYVARMIAIESQIEVVEGPPVQTRQFDFVEEAA